MRRNRSAFAIVTESGLDPLAIRGSQLDRLILEQYDEPPAQLLCRAVLPVPARLAMRHGVPLSSSERKLPVDELPVDELPVAIAGVDGAAGVIPIETALKTDAHLAERHPSREPNIVGDGRPLHRTPFLWIATALALSPAAPPWTPGLHHPSQYRREIASSRDPSSLPLRLVCSRRVCAQRPNDIAVSRCDEHG